MRFPQDETGRQCKLSCPWHGPYRIVERRDPDVTVVKVYAPQDGQIQIHQDRVTPCPPRVAHQVFSGMEIYIYKRSKPGRPPKWVDRLLQGTLSELAEVVPTQAIEPAEISPSTVDDLDSVAEVSELPTSVIQLYRRGYLCSRHVTPDRGTRQPDCGPQERTSWMWTSAQGCSTLPADA